MLVAVIFLLALFTIALAVALPKVSKEIQRDRDLETMQRGKQYARAVRMYYKKFNAYPPNVDALVKPTNNIKYMRKKYVDPTTGKDDWKPVRYGQNKAPMAMGFFGQPMGGTGGCSANTLGTTTSQSSSSSGGTSSSSTSSSTNCATTGLNTSSDTSSTTGGTPPTDPNAANTNTTSSSTTGPTGSTTGLNGQTFGGGGIIGFSPNSPKQSILVYKKKNHYNEWEFVYDPIIEQMIQGGNTGTIGTPASATTTNNTTPTTTTSSTPATTTTTQQ
jgi:type II secretory pathway pseudopilin PulG